jgi:peptide/nickel transport system permease protein
MRRYIIKKILHAAPLLIGISVLGFGIMQLAPGGPTALYTLNPNIRVEDIERIKQIWGLDRPLHVQYLVWSGRLLTGNWGSSFRGGQPVLQLILARIPATLELMGTAYAIAILLGFLVGILGAVRPYSVFDHLATSGAMIALSFPTFWFGLMVIYVFAEKLAWIPSGGIATLGAHFSLVDRLHHLIAPASVLGLVLTASWCRYTRSNMFEVLQSDFVRTAAAKGLSRSAVIWKHALRNALGPLIALGGLQVPWLFSGALVTESIFGWAGMGRLFVDALTFRDYPLLMALLMFTATLVVLGNLLADIALAWADPRIMFGRRC